ncbi:MAG: hydrogenase maturation protease [Acetobacteraceae bacterium]|nr:hydrogenase maturation protease [Acetobacteraceae bacterium]
MPGRGKPGRQKRFLILGLGNPIVKDDAVGLVLAPMVGRLLPENLVDVDGLCGGGLEVVERMVGYEGAAVIDAFVAADARPGEVRRFAPGAAPGTHRTSFLHGIGLREALSLMREISAAVPGEVLVYGVAAREVTSFGEGLSAELQARLGEAAAVIARDLRAAWRISGPARKKGDAGCTS